MTATAVALAVSTQAQEPRVERVQFEPGATGATIEGRITGRETVHYRLGAGAGQTMTVSLDTAHGATTFNVYAPGSEPGRDSALFRGEIDGPRVEGELPYPGDYTIVIAMMRSAARRDEAADYELTVTIEGDADPTVDAPEAGPWPVDTDARGDFPCSTGKAELDLRCTFRVQRNPYGATIWIVRPGDGRDPSTLELDDLRMLSFEKLDDAKFTVDDANEPIRWQRDDVDSWIVVIGDGERYWIPDAAIWGG